MKPWSELLTTFSKVHHVSRNMAKTSYNFGKEVMGAVRNKLHKANRFFVKTLFNRLFNRFFDVDDSSIVADLDDNDDFIDAITINYEVSKEEAQAFIRAIGGQETSKGVELAQKIACQLKNHPNIELDDKIPPEYLCPISFTIMQDPVDVITYMYRDGKVKEARHTMDRQSIEKYIHYYNNYYNPINRQEILQIDNNESLQQEINHFLKYPKQRTCMHTS